MKNDNCICPTGRPLGADHLDECPQAEKKTVTVFRNPVGTPVAVPEEIVLAAERPYRAWTRHRDGISWDVIAVEEGYATADAVRKDVARYLREGEALVSEWTKQELLSVEVARLDWLFSKVVTQCEQGHLPAINVARGLVVDKIKALRLDQADEGDGTGVPVTVVVPVDAAGYSGTLKKVVDNG